MLMDFILWLLCYPVCNEYHPFWDTVSLRKITRCHVSKQSLFFPKCWVEEKRMIRTVPFTSIHLFDNFLKMKWSVISEILGILLSGKMLIKGENSCLLLIFFIGNISPKRTPGLLTSPVLPKRVPHSSSSSYPGKLSLSLYCAGSMPVNKQLLNRPQI